MSSLTWRQAHRAEEVARVRRWKQANKERVRKYNREREKRLRAEGRIRKTMPRAFDPWVKMQAKFGLTREQYEAMVVAQAGVCRICGGPQKAPFKRLAVDHDHTTGKIRGLLCSPCNLAVGWLEKITPMMESIRAYLASA